MTTSVEAPALAKVVLHAARHWQRAVSGVLLGRRQAPAAVVDAVPLFHAALPLSAMLDVALQQIEDRYAAKDLQIIGYYQANEHVDDTEPDFVATKVCEKIAENTGSALLLMVDNRRLSDALEAPPFTASLLSHEGRWRQRDAVTATEEALETASGLLQRRAQRDIVDFDLHLEDISLDWANSHINALC